MSQQEGRVQAHLNPWFSGHLISKRQQEMWSKDTAVYTVVPLSAGVLKLTLCPVLHYILPEASMRGTAKGVSVVYLPGIKAGSLFMLTSCGRLRCPMKLEQRKGREGDG